MDSPFGFGVLLLVATGLLLAAHRIAPSLAQRLAPALGAAFPRAHRDARRPPPVDEQVHALPEGITLTSARLSWQDRLTGVLGLLLFVSFGAVALAATAYLIASMLAHLVTGAPASSG